MKCKLAFYNLCLSHVGAVLTLYAAFSLTIGSFIAYNWSGDFFLQMELLYLHLNQTSPGVHKIVVHEIAVSPAPQGEMSILRISCTDLNSFPLCGPFSEWRRGVTTNFVDKLFMDIWTFRLNFFCLWWDCARLWAPKRVSTKLNCKQKAPTITRKASPCDLSCWALWP